MAKFTEVPHTSELITAIANASNFDKMKAAKYESESKLRVKYGNHFTVYRKG